VQYEQVYTPPQQPALGGPRHNVWIHGGFGMNNLPGLAVTFLAAGSYRYGGHVVTARVAHSANEPGTYVLGERAIMYGRVLWAQSGGYAVASTGVANVRAKTGDANDATAHRYEGTGLPLEVQIGYRWSHIGAGLVGYGNLNRHLSVWSAVPTIQLWF
jgi:hypothetical protein